MFALQAVQRFRDRWEQTERNNLKGDIQRKVAHVGLDKHYKEVNELEDAKEMDERIEKAIKPKEGVEPLSEEARLSAIKRARLNFMTKSFQDPEGAAAHQK